MAAATFMAGGPGGRRKRSPVTFGRVIAAIGVAMAIAVIYNMLSWQSVSDRPNEMKTTQVILPPPPPLPPPEPKPVEQPPEPTVAPPIEQPLDTPPPPEAASNDPVQGDSALTAREGAGPSNYGLAAGDGGGTRIGGRPGGGDAFRAYAAVALNGIRQAAQSDRELSRGRYTVQLAVSVDSDGRITDVRIIDGGDEKRNARLRAVLTGLQLSRRPPAGLPVMRIQLDARS
ncbi:hypothetical protein [Sphingobium baderi]|uniref:Protein TonB n=1 Tax=Sphingobium baderi TaxID=1332080 RepID=A0A0S3EZP7_9SPHN|nr:hypothetical protein [Sphingobium baderi]ALR20904.1 TonB-dependent receptor [Sphingobium baderi]